MVKAGAAAAAAIIVVAFAASRIIGGGSSAGSQGGGQGGPGGMGGPGGAGGASTESQIPTVAVTNPETGTIELTSALIGTVEPADVVYVYPKASGDVLEVLAKAGDTVKAGQVLCRLDTKQVDSAKNSMDSAQLSLQDAQTNLQRQQVLYASGDISAQSFEQHESAVKSAQIQYNTAKLNYDHQVEYSSITSPITGKIETSDVEVYDTVSAANQIFVISGEGNKRVSFSVTERLMKNMNQGDTITIEKNGTQYSGAITEVSTMVDSSTGLYKIKASLDGDGLSTGASVKLYAVSDRAEGVMTIPVDSIYYENEKAYVYTFDNGTVHKKEVTVGIYDSSKAEIQAGLTMDEQVITTWSSELYEGAAAQVLGAEPAAEGSQAAVEGSQPTGEAAQAADGAQTAAESAPASK